MGNCVEWFDFGVYSYVAGMVGATFFPARSEPAQLLAAFAAFAVSFLVRPLGGTFFGPLGDKIGRQRVLIATILLMSGSTVAIGLLPGYSSIGLWAPALLLFIRMLQGFSTGGEYGGAATFIAEYAPDRRRGFLGSWLEFGTLSGYVLGSGTAAVLTATLSVQDMLAWGWRIPFLAAGPLGLVGLLLRYRLGDTPVFEELKRGTGISRSPLRDTLAHGRASMATCVGIVIALAVADYTLLTYMPSYLTGVLTMDSGTGLMLSVGIMLAMMAMIVPVGALSDRVGRRPIQIVGAVGFIVLAIPAFMLIHLRSIFAVAIGLLLLGMCMVCFLGTIPATLPALFPTPVRYGAFAVSYNVSVSIFGGTTPLVVEYLTTELRNLYVPAFYVMAAMVIALVPIIRSPETARRPLPATFRDANAAWRTAGVRRPRVRVKPSEQEEPG
jgi:MFS transporter, MHS family, proline/betaine transporter